MAEGIAGLAGSVRDGADDLHRRHTVLGFPYAVVKKYGDDEGSRHAAATGIVTLLTLVDSIAMR